MCDRNNPTGFPQKVESPGYSYIIITDVASMPVRQKSRSDAILAMMRAQQALTRASPKGQRSVEEVSAVRKKIISDLQPRPKLVVRPKAVQPKRTAVGNQSPLRRSLAPTTGATFPAQDQDSTPREPTPPVDELRLLANLMRCVLEGNASQVRSS